MEDRQTMTSWTDRPSGRHKHADDARSDYEIDYARVVHSGSFRRLQGKTQILSLGDDDFYRTRLTHSMEVAQVAEGVVQQLRLADLPSDVLKILPPISLIHAIGLSHDIGHPPFGHGGELALNYCMRDHGGFEGNAQTLRILTRLESYSDKYGADLTRRTLLGVLKYPVLRETILATNLFPSLAASPTTIAVLDPRSCKPPKACYESDADTLDWVFAQLSDEDRVLFGQVIARTERHGASCHKSIDCSIMDVADDIAYGVHDLEDAIALGFISHEQFESAIVEIDASCLSEALAERPLVAGGSGDLRELGARLFGSASERKGAIGRLIHFFIRSVEVVEQPLFAEPLIRSRAVLRAAPRTVLTMLQGLVVHRVIDDPRVQNLEFKGQRMVVAVFEALMTDPKRLLPRDVAAAYISGKYHPRAVCDHLASFTDAALQRTYDRLFSPRSGSVFDRI